MKHIYHSSPKQDLKVITPKKGTHGKEWVYGTPDLATSAVFLGRLGGDFTLASGHHRDNGKPFLVERYPGAFNERYGGLSGSIYVLPADNFIGEQTGWSGDWVSEIAVEPIEEIKVDNVARYLLDLADKGELIIKYYPERFDWIPEDDQDLVEKAAKWIKTIGPDVLDDVKKFHPGLVDRVKEKI